MAVASILMLAACTSDPDPGAEGAADQGVIERDDEATAAVGEDDPTTTTATDEGPEGESPEPGRPQSPDGTPTDDSGLWLGRGEMSESGIELFWSDLDRAARYRIHRLSRDDVADPDEPELTDETLIHDTDSAAPFTDSAVEPAARYWYVLVAFDDGGGFIDRRWTMADAVTDDEPPTPVTGLEAAVTDDQVVLTWDPSADNYRFERYAIRRSVDGEPSVYYGTGWTIDQTSFIDDAPPSSGIVVYEVIATDFHDNLAPAAVVTVSL